MSETPKNNNSDKEIGDNIDEILEILDKYKIPEEKKSSNKNDESDPNESTKQAPVIQDAVTTHFTEVFDPVVVKKDQDKNDMTVHFAAIEDGEEDSEIEKEAELERLPKKKRKKANKEFGIFGLFSSIFKTIMYLVFVIGVSAYVSYNTIRIGNEVFAFVKPSTEVDIVITENMTTADVANLLKENGVIEYDWAFKLYVKYRSAKDTYLPGEHKITFDMNYDEIVNALTVVKVEREIVQITVPEGYSIDQIIDLLISEGIGNRAEYVDVINNYDFKHDFMQKLKEIQLSPNRKYRLEGYLFPDTYFFYQDDSAVTVINKFLNNFESKFDESFYTRCDELGMNLDEVITLASMAEAEAKFSIDLEYVSSVFHNRLNNWTGTDRKMQSDATIQYVLPEHKEDLSQADLDLDNPYNTYMYTELPPSAICNPGIDAISAALWPDDPVDSNGKSFKAYFFVSNKYGKIYYAQTEPVHNQNKRQAEKDNLQYDEYHNNESTTN